MATFNPQLIVSTVITVALIACACVLAVFTVDPTMHALVPAIITGILALWIPSPVQPVTPIHVTLVHPDVPATTPSVTPVL